jgi:hypothetical protein
VKANSVINRFGMPIVIMKRFHEHRDSIPPRIMTLLGEVIRTFNMKPMNQKCKSKIFNIPNLIKLKDLNSTNTIWANLALQIPNDLCHLMSRMKQRLKNFGKILSLKREETIRLTLEI